MKKTKMNDKIVLIISVITILIAAFPLNVYAAKVIEKNGVTITKISNPDAGQREVDGLINGGDRENSYAWRLAERGDYIYIATNRNVASAIINMYGGLALQAGLSREMMWSIVDTVTNGEIPRSDENSGANIISYHKTTGEFKVIYTAEDYTYFRMAVTFGDNVYFGSYSANPDVAQYILKLDKEGNFTKVFITKGAVSLRATCVYDDHLYFAGADEREILANGDEYATKIAVLQKSNEDDTVWTRVADYKDFGEYAFDSIMSSWAGAPVWELSSYKGYIYATLPSTAGFIMFKGHPATGSEIANEYGWYWEEVVGKNNEINEPGLSTKKGGEPGTMRSLIGSTFVFKDELYAYNFDHGFGGELLGFVGLVSQISGNGAKASDFLKPMYDSLQNPQSLWKLNDETGKFEECKGFTELVKGTTNEYVWRAGEYDGQMYIATFDAATLYNYFTRLTNGSFTKMTEEEIQEQIGYMNNLIELLSESDLKEKFDLGRFEDILKYVRDILSMLDEKNIDFDTIKDFLSKYPDVNVSLKDLEKAIDNLIHKIKEEDIEEIVDKYLDEELINSLIDQYITEENIEKIINSISGDQDIEELISQYIDEEQKEEIINKIKEKLGYAEDKDIPLEDVVSDVKETVVSYLKNAIKSNLETTKEKIIEAYKKIDWEGLEMYKYISDMVKEDNWGFDLIRTADGENFELITDDGFEDRYNYGAPSFLATDEGLYIGTCNPFYGGQLYLLTTGNEGKAEASGEIEDEVYYEVLFELNEGNFSKTYDNPVKVLDGECIVKPENPTRSGYRFDDWYIDKELTTKFDFDTPIKEDTILYANWSRIISGGGSSSSSKSKKVEAKPQEVVPWSNASEWAIEELTKANEKGLIPSTFDKKDFTKAITRKDFAAVVVKLYEAITKTKVEPVAVNPFVDTDDEEVLKAYAVGITLGTSETTFTPDMLITREQMATMLTRGLSKAEINIDIDLEDVNRFVDDYEMHDWGREAIYFMSEKDIIKGIGDNRFNSLGNATFEQSLAIVLRSVNIFEK